MSLENLTTQEFIKYLLQNGFVLRAIDDKLRCINPGGNALTKAIKAEINLRKNSLLEYLRLQLIPLSFAQQRLWFLQQYDVGACTSYNIPLVFKLDGPLDVQVLEAAINFVIARHDIFRTVFKQRSGIAYQEVLPNYQIAIENVVLAKAEGLMEFLKHEAAAPFNLEVLPLLRVKLITIALGKNAESLFFAVTLHHIISDGWSINIFLRELQEFYNAKLDVRNLALEPVIVQYQDYVHWQLQQCKTDAYRESLAYWCKTLADVPQLNLALSFPRPTLKTYCGARLQGAMQYELCRKLQTLANEQNTSLFILLLTAFSILLSFYCQQDDIAIGTPVANRKNSVFDGVLGLFMNLIVVRHKINSQQTFLDFLSDVKAICMQAYQHQSVPFEKIVDALGVHRNLDSTPLFQVMFLLEDENALIQNFKLTNLNITKLAPFYDTAKLDLTVTFVKNVENFTYDFEYNSDIFDANTIVELRDHFAALLAAIVKNPGRIVRELFRLTPFERQKILFDWNATDHDFSEQGETLGELFAKQAAQTPESIALIDGERKLTYRELDEESAKFGNYLRHRYHVLYGTDIIPNMLFALCLRRSAEFLIALLGILKTGAAYVPLDPDYPDARLQFMLDDSEAKLIIVEEKLQGRFAGFAEFAPKLAIFDDYSLCANLPITVSKNFASSADLVYVIYTSGTTGKPKGALVTHSNVSNYFAWVRDYVDLAGHEIVDCSSSIAFDLTVTVMLVPLFIGSTIVLCSEEVKKDPMEFCRHLTEHKINVIKLTPSYFNLLVDLNSTLPSVTKIILGGESVDKEKIKRWLERHPWQLIFNEYGPTEATVGATQFAISSKNIDDFPVIPIGKPAYNTKIYVLGKNLQPVPIGVVGELYIAGANVAQGYLRRDELTEEKFVRDILPCSENVKRAYKTGDLAKWDRKGNLIYCGRCDEQVKIRGFRIELEEISAAMNAHAAVQNSIALIHDHHGQKQIIAYFIARQAYSKDELRSYLQMHLPDYMVPQVFIEVKEFSLTVNGKIDKSILPAPINENYAISALCVAPQSALECQLINLWQRILNLENIGTDDNFFTLGGDSIVSIQVVAQAREQGIMFKPRDLFANPTVRELAAYVEFSVQNATSTASAITRVSAFEDINKFLADVSIEDAYNLAPLQYGLLFHSLPGQNAGQYAVQLHWDFTNLDIVAFKKAWQWLVDRHAVLRTSFRSEDIAPVQIVHKKITVPWHEIDFSDYSKDEQARKLAHYLQEERNLDFDLQNPCLMRLTLIKFTTESQPEKQRIYHFIWTHHHIILDGWCMPILLDELYRCYTAYRHGIELEAGVKAIPPPYKNYLSWLKNLDKQAAHEFWRGQLSDFSSPTALNLNVKELQIHVPISDLAEFILHVDSVFTQKCLEFVRRIQTTLSTLLQLAWALVLSRYNDSADILFGTVISGRTPEVPCVIDMIGLFINTVPLRMKLKREVSVVSMLRELHLLIQDVNQHGVLSLAEIQKYANLHSGTPLFYTLFAFENYPVKTDNTLLANAKFQEKTNYPLTVTAMLIPATTELQLKISYDAQCFKSESITRLAEHLKNVIQWLIMNPDLSLRCADILSLAERKHLLLSWNSTSKEFSSDKTLQQMFEEQVAKTPENIALLYCEQEITYREVNERANQVANYLQEIFYQKRGVQFVPGTLIGLSMPRCVEMMIGILAILKAGGAYVPLDPQYPEKRLCFMLEDTGAEMVLTTEDILRECQFLRKNTASTMQRVLIPLDERHRFSKYSRANLPCTSTARDLAYVIYTSGSTGAPKGVMLEHLGVVNLAQYLAKNFNIGPGVRVLQFASLNFDASVYEWGGALLAGAELQLLAEAELPPHNDLGIAMAEKAVNIAVLPPAICATLMNIPLPHLDILVSAGDKCTRDLVWHFVPRCRFINAYGPTETTVCCSMGNCASDETINIGKALDNHTLYVLDSDLHPVPVGIPGELYVGGVGLARGYLNQPELTREKFIVNPFIGDVGWCKCNEQRLYKTGDIVRRLPSGALEYLGRTDEQIKLRGFRIELGEIEVALREVPEVKHVAVTIDRERERIIAYLVLLRDQEIDQQITIEAIKKRLTSKLPAHMIPQNFVFLPELPLNHSGKVDKKSLPEPDIANDAADKYLAPRNALERKLAEIWGEVLRSERIGINDNYFVLGGDSIISIQILSKARQCGVKFTARDLFSNPTIAELARMVETSASFSSHAKILDKDKNEDEDSTLGTVPLMPIQQWFFAQNPRNVHHFNQGYLLCLKKKIDGSMLRQAINLLIEMHPTLCLRYRPADDGWEQYYETDPKVFDFHSLEVALQKAQDEAEQSAQITMCCNELQARLNITDGPILGAVLFSNHQDGCQRLFFVLHHLVIDGVSWRILLEDLAKILDAALENLKNGQNFWENRQNRQKTIAEKFPYFSMSYKKWAKNVINFARSGALDEEFSHWKGAGNGHVDSLKADFVSPSPTVSDLCDYQVIFNEHDTRQLLQRVHHAYHTKVDDLLLAALLLAMHSYSRAYELFFALESHGREAFDDSVDLTRTLGWFTALYPVCLKLPHIADISSSYDVASVIKTVKEQLRKIPRKGIGYGILRYFGSTAQHAALAEQSSPQISFNYLGQFDGIFNDNEWFSAEEEDIGACAARENGLPYLLSINCWVVNNKLQMHFSYSAKHFLASSIAKFGDLFQEHLSAIIAHCAARTIISYTPSDFPHAALTQEFLDKMLASPGNIISIYPLSPLQQGLFFHAIYSPNTDQYATQVTWRYEGNLSSTNLRKAWESLVTRHEIFRSSFVLENLSEPVRVVYKNIVLPWHEIDLPFADEEEQNKLIAEYLECDRRQGFDLKKPGIMRLHLLQLGSKQFQFVWTHHHILLDGWSLAQIITGLKDVYLQLCQADGLSQQLVDNRSAVYLEPPYKNYCAWLRGQNQVAAADFWHQELLDFTGPTPFHINQQELDIHKPIVELSTEKFLCDAEFTANCSAFARGNALTLNTLLQFSWALVLAKYSGNEDVTFGAVLSGRDAEVSGIERMVGLFINTVPLRIKIDFGAHALTQLKFLQKHTQQINHYGYLPLSAIQEQASNSIATRAPLFFSILVFENYPLPSNLDMLDLGIKVNGISSYEKPNYPLTLVVIPGAQLQLEAIYDSQVFTRDSIKRLLRHVRNALHWLVNHAESKISAAEILCRDEKYQLAVAWNQTVTDYPRNKTIDELFVQQVKLTPANIALDDGVSKLTYGELDAKSDKVAHWLRTGKKSAAALIALCMERSADMVIAMIGILKAGYAYVPIDINSPADRITYIIKDTAAPFLVIDHKLLAKFNAEVFAPCQVITIEDCLAKVGIDKPVDNFVYTKDKNCLAHVIYTSGSTGKPKGCLIEHKGVVRLVKGQNYLQISDQDVMAQISNPAFDAATFEIWSALLNGAKLMIIPRETVLDNHKFLDFIRHENITIIFLTTGLFNSIVLSGIYDFSGVRALLTGGEKVNPAVVHSLWAAKDTAPQALLHCYGPTESTTYTTTYTLTESPVDSRDIPIGQPIANTQVYVLDKYLKLVPIGIPGELYVGGDGIARGYLNNPELTQEKFSANPLLRDFLGVTHTLNKNRILGLAQTCSSSLGIPRGAAERASSRDVPPGRLYLDVHEDGERWPQQSGKPKCEEHIAPRVYRTGDIVRWLPDGNLQFLHRVDSQVKIRGFRIELEEINFWLTKHSAVKQSAVVVSEHDNEKLLAAYLVLQADTSVSRKQLRQYLMQYLPDYMLPQAFVYLANFSLNTSGKIDYKSLPRPEAVDFVGTENYLAPRNEIEEKLADIWQEVLHGGKIGVYDDFFALGGHSLNAMRIIFAINEIFSLDVPIKTIFIANTVEKLGEIIAAEMRTSKTENITIEKI